MTHCAYSVTAQIGGWGTRGIQQGGGGGRARSVRSMLAPRVPVVMRGRPVGTRVHNGQRLFPYRQSNRQQRDSMLDIVTVADDAPFWHRVAARVGGRRWRRALIRASQKRASFGRPYEYVSELIPPVDRGGIARPHGVPPVPWRLHGRRSRRWRR